MSPKKYQTGDLETDPQAMFARQMTEETLLQNVLGCARGLGWLAYHTRDSRRSAEGFPDLVLVRGAGVTIYAELKTEAGELKPAQVEWLTRLAFASHRSAQNERGDYEGRLTETGAPWEPLENNFPPMRGRLVQVYVWRPRDWLSGWVQAVLK